MDKYVKNVCFRLCGGKYTSNQILTNIWLSDNQYLVNR